MPVGGEGRESENKQRGRASDGGWGEVIKGEKRAGINWERGLGEELLPQGGVSIK